MNGPLASYTFLPWLRQGIGSKIKRGDPLGAAGSPLERASIRVGLQVQGEPDFVSGDVQLVGPGDIMGINPRAIVRTEPRPWVTDFEPNYLAFIEFYDEDFPWRYTPARAVEMDQGGSPVDDSQQTKLRPWFWLLVLGETEFEPGASSSGLLPVVRLTDAALPEVIFPPTDQTWAWAHVQVSQDITANHTHTMAQTVEALENLVRQNPDEALSRLVCPRKLKPLTGFHAFLIPAFEAGRLAGLGLSTAGQDTLAPSWGAGQKEYPVYYQWRFRTGERGDFESLVNLLQPRPVDERVGVRDLDLQKPGFGVPGMIDGPGDEPVMGLEGALKSPQAAPRPDAWPPAAPANYPDFLRKLEEQVNLQDTLLHPPDPAVGHPDPVVSPPLYGRWHALQRRLNVEQEGWVNELNRDPRYRAPAGLGTQVIQAHQETYMQKAWQQLGDILKANQKIRQAQLALAVSHRVYVRHLLPLADDQKFTVTQPVHSRVMGSPTTILQQVKASRLPEAALSPAFRRVARPRGAVLRKAGPEIGGKTFDVVTPLNQGRITAAPPKTAPERQISLDETAEALVPPQVPRWLRLLLKHPLFRRILSLMQRLFGPGALTSVDQLQQTVLAADRLKSKNLTVEAARRVEARPGFVLTEPGQEVPRGIVRPGSSDSIEAANFRTALLDLHARFEVELPQPPRKTPLNLGRTASTLVRALNPVLVIPRRARSVVAIPATFKYLRPLETIVPVMAHPVFADPMYQPLRDLSSELLIPNLHLIPNNTITLLKTNFRFIEAYMVGLNHEMARELLWRRYDTDQRGSYFRQFWDVSDLVNRDESKDAKTLEEERRDIKPLHTWGRDSALGTHENRVLPTGGEPDASRLVLVIRGDLLRKYPTAVIYAQKARWTDDPEDPFHPPRKIRVLDESNPEVNHREPIFKAEIEPDLRFLGFDLTVPEAKGDPTPPADANDPGNPGWFFVIQQRPGEPRFGLDILAPEEGISTPEAWNELAWNHLGDPEILALIDLDDAPPTNITEGPDKDIEWGANAADLAYILYQVPVMVAVHADDMLE